MANSLHMSNIATYSSTAKQPKTLVVTSTSQPETVFLGKLLGSNLATGDVLVLTGDLGAGKTQLTKGIAQALGITEDITSPTFTIEMVYTTGELDLFHFDLYRLDAAEQLEDTGIFDVLGVEGVCVLEWGEQFIDELGDSRLDIVITRLSGDEKRFDFTEPARRIACTAHDARAEVLLHDFARSLEAENLHVSWV